VKERRALHLERLMNLPPWQIQFIVQIGVEISQNHSFFNLLV
jgi:hypothetical protein